MYFLLPPSSLPYVVIIIDSVLIHDTLINEFRIVSCICFLNHIGKIETF
jgi:hypothetical protein